MTRNMTISPITVVLDRIFLRTFNCSFEFDESSAIIKNALGKCQCLLVKRGGAIGGPH